MDMKLEVVTLPVTDVDRARDFYVDKAGFTLDQEHRVHESLRFVQITPPGSACSIAFGEGLTTNPPGSAQVMVVVEDARATRKELLARGVEATDIDVQSWGIFTYFTDPDGNAWAVQQLVPMQS